MRDSGLSEAIKAAGGVGALADMIGISQPSVSNWTRVPAERVVAVEAVTGISRDRLRPDLYAMPDIDAAVDEVDAARANEYALLAALLTRAPDADLLARFARLRGDPTPLGLAHLALADAAAAANPEQIEREFFNLFIGLGRGELMPYGSYYQSGFLYERPLARLRGDLEQLGIARADGNSEPEDHAATLCEIMAGIVAGRFPAPAGADRDLFDKHIAPWMGRLFSDMEQAESANFYRCVGALGRVFLAIETEAFALPS